MAISSVSRQSNPKMDNRGLLKQATALIHERTEAKWFDLGQFTSKEAYLKWLGAMLSVHADLGTPAAHAIADPNWVALEGERISALQRDLDLDHPPQNAAVKFGTSYSWGVLYAVSGSALGATVLERDVAARHDWPTKYLRKLSGFARSGGVRLFFDKLNQSHLEFDEAQRGATAVFEALAD